LILRQKFRHLLPVFETRGEGVQDTEDTEDVAEKREEVGETVGAE
jgi:hypothetical protein